MRWIFVAGVVVLGCSSAGPAPPHQQTPNAVPSCDPGTRPAAGNSTCLPVGTTNVPGGFAPDGAWGFRPVLPAGCTGATIATLGATDCKPIDDCSAAFPPVDAAIAVNPTGAAYADRPGLPVVTTLAEALAKLPKGGTIAVDEGQFDLPPTIDVSTNIVGRCAEKTSLRGADFGVVVASPIQVGLSSLAIIGSPKVALLVDHHATVKLDRVYVHGDNDGAEAGNGATLDVTHSVFEGPPSASPNFATAGVQAIYDGQASLNAVEVRGYQLAVYAQSVGTQVTVQDSVLHEQPRLSAETEELATIGAFLGAEIKVDTSYVESTPGRIAIVGAALLNGASDPTSPGDPPAALQVTGSSLVQALMPRDTGSAIDVIHAATLGLDNVSLKHDCFVGISASESAAVTIRSSVIQEANQGMSVRSALAALSGGSFTVDASALVGSSGGAIVLGDQTTSLQMTGSLVTGNREVEVHDPTVFRGAGQALTIAPGGRATLSDSAFVDNQGTALFVQGGTVDANTVVFTGTHPSSLGPFSAAVTAIDSAVMLRSSLLAANDRALALQSGRALVRDGAVIDEKEAFRLDGLAFVQTSAAVDQPVASELIAARTEFARNAVLVSHKPLTAE